MAVTPIDIRTEREADRPAVHDLNVAAFEQQEEADLVDALRDDPAFVPELSIVAVEYDEVVGHILLTRATLTPGSTPVLALAPMAVRPDRQRRGIGAALVEEGLARARTRSEEAMVLVLGHPGFYPRFGFEPAGRAGVTTPFEVPEEAWMLVPLPAYAGQGGTIAWAPPFGTVR